MNPDTRLADALPDYSIVRELGRGAMGIVYLGEQKSLGRSVAIKELPEAFVRDQTVRERFLAEAKALGRLGHPHVVPVYEFVERPDMCALVMEALPGGTVWSRFIDTGLTPQESCALVIATAAGLQHAHERGILHRDIKPENLLFDEAGTLKVSDFGIAKVVNGATTKATVEGSVLGTPAYMAPEQAEGRDVDERADVYAAGTMLFELLSGRLPYEPTDGGPLSLLTQRITTDPPDIGDVAPATPPEIAAVVMKSLARDPKDRYSTAEDFGCALGEAAATAWGPDWGDATGVPVHGSERLSASMRTTHNPIVTDDPLATQAAGMASVAPTQAIRPSSSAFHPAKRTGGGTAMEAGDLLSVGEMLTPPAFPVIQLVVGVVALVVAAIIGIVGFGSVDRVSGLEPGVVTINGTDVTDGTIDLDLTGDTTLVISEIIPGADQVRLEIVGADIELTDIGPADVEVGEPIVWESSSARWYVGGSATGRLVFTDTDGSEVVSHEFEIDNTGRWLTGSGAIALILALAVFAYLESNIRPLRKGRRKISALVGMFITGAFVGLLFVALGAVLGYGEPTVPHLIVAALAGAVGSAALGWALLTVGRRGRIRRASRTA
ncbi:MAG: protein kinase [Acidimicrobiales bacterium]